MPMPEQPQNDEQFPLDSRVAIMQAEDATPEAKEQAFRSVCEEHYQDMLRYAAFLTKSNDNSEDIVQEAFAKVWSKIEQYESGKVPFKAWLVRVVHNQAIDFKRKAYIRNESSFDLGRGYIALEKEVLHLEEPNPIDIDGNLMFQDTLRVLQQIGNYKILMQSAMGLSTDEISEIHGITKSGAFARIHKARRTARLIIEEQRAA
jgi:RNA polymerase sigma factor (sigma-70 family)